MTTQQTIRVRTANNSRPDIGKHLTLCKVVNTENSVFGFAMMDDGEKVYVPATMIRSHQMKSEDAEMGAGFTAHIYPNPRANDSEESVRFVITNPLKWDGEAEEIVVDTPVMSESYDSDVEKELVKLAESADDMVLDAANSIRETVVWIKDLRIKDATVELGRIADKLEAFRGYIDECAPSDGN